MRIGMVKAPCTSLTHALLSSTDATIWTLQPCMHCYNQLWVGRRQGGTVEPWVGPERKQPTITKMKSD
jgi:hypothetical protein